MAPSYNILEDKSNDGPGDVVDGGCGRDETGSVENDGPVDIAEEAVGPFQRRGPCDGGQESADEEEEDKSVVDLSLAELMSGADDTPDDGCGTKHFCARADEAIGLGGRAHVSNVGEHPSLNTKLDGTSHDGGDDLSPEHGTRGKFHVVTKLEIG